MRSSGADGASRCSASSTITAAAGAGSSAGAGGVPCFCCCSMNPRRRPFTRPAPQARRLNADLPPLPPSGAAGHLQVSKWG